MKNRTSRDGTSKTFVRAACLPTFLGTLLGVLLLAAAPASAQNLDEELRFVEGLAEAGYFDLAEDYLKEHLPAGSLPEEKIGQLLLTRARLQRQAAFSQPREDLRQAAFEEALDLYRQFVDKYDEGKLVDEARFELAQLLQDRGRYLVERLELEKGMPAAEQDKLRQEAGGIFEEAVRTLVRLYSLFEQEGNSDQALTTLYYKGVCYFNWSKVFPRPQKEFEFQDKLRQAHETLEDLIWQEEVTGSARQLFSYLYLGQVFGAQGEIQQAVGCFDYIEQTIVLDEIAGRDADTRGQVQALLERSHFRASEILNKASRYQDVIAKADALAAIIKKLGGRPGPFGDLTAIEKARAYQQLGRSGDAIALAVDISGRNEGNTVGIVANKFLSDVQSQAGAMLPANVMYSAAEGKRASKQYSEAIDLYHSVLTSLSTPEDRVEYGAKAWNGIGNCYAYMNRYLEAGIAFEEGFERHITEDVENSLECLDNAKRAFGRRYNETKTAMDEERFKKIEEKYVNALSQYANSTGGIGGKIFLARANSYADESNFSEARSYLKRITQADPYFERALVTQGIIDLKEAKASSDASKKSQLFAQATQRFDDYFAFVAKPENKVADPEASARREESIVQATYYKANVAFEQGRFAQVETLLGDFETRFPRQESFVPVVWRFRIESFLETGNENEAVALAKKLFETYPNSQSIVAAVALTMAQLYDRRAEALKPAYETAQQKLTTAIDETYSASRVLPIEEELAAARKAYFDQLAKATEYLDFFNKNGTNVPFTNYEIVADNYKDMGRYDQAVTAYNEIVRRFGNDPQQKKVIESRIRLDIGEVHLASGNFDEALKIWQAFVDQNVAEIIARKGSEKDPRTGDRWDPTNAEYWSKYLFSIGGSVEFEGRERIERDGKGQWSEAATQWTRMSKRLPDYTNEWYFAKFHVAYNLYRSGKTKTGDRDLSKRVIQNLILLAGPQIDPKWKERFEWLERKVR